MDELQRKYMESIKFLAGVLVGLALLLTAVLRKYGKLQEYVTSSISLLFIVGEWVIRKHLWKLMCPRINLKGEWDGISNFEAYEAGPSQEVRELPEPANYKVLFEQDSLNLKIAPTHAERFVSWASDTISMDREGSIVFAYHVRYTGGPFPSEAIGIERLDVVKRGFRGRPLLMLGTFEQCARGSYPVYRGRVEYRRKK